MADRDCDRDAIERLTASLAALLGPNTVQANRPLASHTTLRVGGPAERLVVVHSAEALQCAVSQAWESGVPCHILGCGSNVLVSDRGIRGLVVLNRARATSFGNGHVMAESGALLSTVARQCVARGLAGLEWAVGIPGTVGGAVVGNAGAWGADTASVLVRARVLEPGGAVADWLPEQLEFGYRTSTLKRRDSEVGRRAVILAAEFSLRPEKRTALQARIAELTAKRTTSQPCGPSCGSTFRNPAGDYAGRLIEAAGLKGQRIGDAQISSQHANFVINRGGATATDVKALIDLTTRVVRERFGRELELEVELAGEWQALE